MSQIDNRVAALLQSAAGDAANATPNTGQGFQGEWPPPGTYELLVKDCRESMAETEAGQGAKTPCVEIAFEYVWEQSVSDPEFDIAKGPKRIEFWGERFQLVPNFEKNVLEKNLKTRYKINWDRFVGHLTKMLGVTKDQITDPLRAYATLRDRIKSGTTVLTVSSLIQYRTYTKKDNTAGTNKTEFILDNLTSPAAS